MTTTAQASPAQRIADLESDAFQTAHHVGRLASDITALRQQGKLHAELIADAHKDLRDLRVDFAEFRSEVRGQFAEVRGEVAEVRGELKEVRGELTEVQGGLTEVRDGLAEVRGEVAGLRNGLTEVRGGLAEVRGQLDQQTVILTAIAAHVGIQTTAARDAGS